MVVAVLAAVVLAVAAMAAVVMSDWPMAAMRRAFC
jgi:hypothetical protein